MRTSGFFQESPCKRIKPSLCHVSGMATVQLPASAERSMCVVHVLGIMSCMAACYPIYSDYFKEKETICICPFLAGHVIVASPSVSTWIYLNNE